MRAATASHRTLSARKHVVYRGTPLNRAASTLLRLDAANKFEIVGLMVGAFLMVCVALLAFTNGA